jgi:menaquinol-cytochrome c reductase iron-sulfur subunit
MSDPGRRRFLKIATCAIGGGIGAVVAVPAVKYLFDPVGRRVVVAPDEPIDVGDSDELEIGGPPVARRLVARAVRDAWSSVEDVPLGIVWLRRTGEDEIVAKSGICPHLGCAVNLVGDEFKCPCHDSSFRADGTVVPGSASERDLDTLPVEEITRDQRRVRVTWIRFLPGGPTAVPA